MLAVSNESSHGFHAVLVTANVFQNCLPKLKQDVALNIALLDGFLRHPIRWYVSEVDYQMIELYWRLFGDPSCESAYLGMFKQVQFCMVNAAIQAEARHHPMSSVSDSIRLACAIDRQVDALVTWEPDHFTRNPEDHDQVSEHGFFDYHLSSEVFSEDADLETVVKLDDSEATAEKPCIRIFSVRAFSQRLV
ncbi:MAG: hypothetical protein AAFW84_01305 [Cyanobacteria bacterium J06635_15]